MFGDGATGSPNLGFGLSVGGERKVRVAWQAIRAAAGDPGYETGFAATRREPANDVQAVHGAPHKGTISSWRRVRRGLVRAFSDSPSSRIRNVTDKMRLEMTNDFSRRDFATVKRATEDRTVAETHPDSERQVMNFHGRVREVGRRKRRTADVREFTMIGVAWIEPFECAVI